MSTQTTPPASALAEDSDFGFWHGRLDAQLSEEFGGAVAWSRACPPKPVVDDAAKFVLRSVAGQPRGVLVGSALAAPDMAARHVRRSSAAAGALGSDLASVVLTPLMAGEVEGRSYAVWPFCRPGNEGRVAQWRWRRRWAGPVSDWLLGVTRATAEAIGPEGLDTRVLAPLEAFQAMAGLGDRSRRAAAGAIDAFSAGRVQPMHVLMHNDLWTGNVLEPGKSAAGGRYPFTIIDWAGAEVAGHPGYDLARWAQSVRLKPAAYGKELMRHAKVLGCDPGVMLAHLSVGLGHLAMHLEGFAPQRFVRLADECMEKAESALACAASE